ncbi:hypothetical protein BK671_01325 [Pseudomonas fluorescens]|uniref:Uncharacterized protein n=1 Tax=Pseudomonas fluorescens TaxID=294 RepID=A0A423LW54_PSEFL|nr:hypothetical protein BK671_01325 [Pseudomonas fluorescens]
MRPECEDTRGIQTNISPSSRSLWEVCRWFCSQYASTDSRRNAEWCRTLTHPQQVFFQGEYSIWILRQQISLHQSVKTLAGQPQRFIEKCIPDKYSCVWTTLAQFSLQALDFHG